MLAPNTGESLPGTGWMRNEWDFHMERSKSKGKKQIRYIDAYMESEKVGLDNLTHKAEIKDTEKKGTDITGKRRGWMSWEIMIGHIHTIATMEK